MVVKVGTVVRRIPNWQVAALADHGLKWCPNCDDVQVVSAFGSKATGYCLDCRRSDYLESHYGIDIHAWNRIFDSQGRVCQICGSPNSSGNGWHTDHDHSCCPGEKSCGGCVRGILCQGCNSALSSFREDLDILSNAIDYLCCPIFHVSSFPLGALDLSREYPRCSAGTRRSWADRDSMNVYGMTPYDKEKVLSLQNGVCAICKGPPNSRGNFDTDHDHSCCPGKISCGFCIRGFLCSFCNTGIGRIYESIETLEAAKGYLVGANS